MNTEKALEVRACLRDVDDLFDRLDILMGALCAELVSTGEVKDPKPFLRSFNQRFKQTFPIFVQAQASIETYNIDPRYLRNDN